MEGILLMVNPKGGGAEFVIVCALEEEEEEEDGVGGSSSSADDSDSSADSPAFPGMEGGGGAKEDEAEGESEDQDAGDRLWEGKKLFVVRSMTGRQKMNPDLRAGFHKKKDVVALGMDFLAKLKESKNKGDSTKAGRHRALESTERRWPVVVCPSRVSVVDSKGEPLDVSAGLPKAPGQYKYPTGKGGKKQGEGVEEDRKGRKGAKKAKKGGEEGGEGYKSAGAEEGPCSR